MATQTRVIIVKSDAKGAGPLKQVSAELGRINRNTLQASQSLKQLGSQFDRFGGVLRTVFAGFAFRELAQSLDTFQLARDRLTVFEGSAESAEKTLQRLVSTARETRTSFDGLSTVYNRIALSSSELGLSSEALIDVTKVLQNTFRLSGATIAEATGATIQLSQGLSSGQLRGQELRSVLEANAVFAGLLAKSFGVARGQLIKLAEAGKITSLEVFKILAKDMDDINDRAGRLGTTIGQSLTLAFDALRVKADELNKRFDITGGIIKGVEFLTNNMERLLRVLGVLVAANIIGKLITQIKALEFAIKSFQATNLVGQISLVTGALLSAAPIVAAFWEDLFPDKTKRTLEDVDKSIKNVASTIGNLKKSIGNIDLVERFTPSDSRLKKLRDLENELQGLLKERTILEKKSFEQSDAYQKAKGTGLKAEIAILEKNQTDERTVLAKLNDEYLRGKVSISEYNQAIKQIEVDEVNKKFVEGKSDLEEYTKALEKIERKFSGDSPLLTGVRQYIESAGTLAQNIANGVEQVFGRLEDSLVEFVKTGKFEFNKFALAVIEDINRIIIRALIVRPLAEAILSFATPGVSGGGGGSTAIGGGGVANTPSASVNAQGNAYMNGQLQKFAKGGLVNQPTFFNYNGNKLGVMGEAGAEAIMPLRRTPSGDLGVASMGGGDTNVQVNVINNNNENEIQTEERTSEDGSRVLDVIITRKVQEAFNSGKMDKTMGGLYGLNRRGR